MRLNKVALTKATLVLSLLTGLTVLFFYLIVYHPEIMVVLIVGGGIASLLASFYSFFNGDLD